MWCCYVCDYKKKKNRRKESTWNCTSYLFLSNVIGLHYMAPFQNLYCCFRYYSMYGHVEKLAEEIKKGAASVEGVEAKLWQVRKCIQHHLVGSCTSDCCNFELLSLASCWSQHTVMQGYHKR